VLARRCDDSRSDKALISDRLSKHFYLQNVLDYLLCLPIQIWVHQRLRCKVGGSVSCSVNVSSTLHAWRGEGVRDAHHVIVARNHIPERRESLLHALDLHVVRQRVANVLHLSIGG
jgi:hypothetical protein